MAAIPGDVNTDQQPPMTVPLRHFLVAVGFLLAGAVVGLGRIAGVVPGLATATHVHLLLAGWICITIMGAMTQFVPVWSGVTLHSRRLASVQLALVVAGLLGFATVLATGPFPLLVVFGALMLAGFWTFVYNVGRTLRTAEDWDVTERHFALALGFFLLLTTLGYLLALDLSRPVFAGLELSRTNVVGAHATLAVFGAVLTTVYGALYQLATMFTQTELHGVDVSLQRVESLGHPVGVVLLAVGRLTGTVVLAQVGGVLVALAGLCVAAILARKLREMQVPWTPMHTRYAVATPALAAWALLAVPAWLGAPTSPAHTLGAPGTFSLLVLGAVGFVVLGTLYHIVPFIVWVHRYSDRLGFEDVPMVDDLYRDRLAAMDATLFVTGTGLLVAADLLAAHSVAVPAIVAPSTLGAVGGVLLIAGVLVFARNIFGVLSEHSPQSLPRILLGSLDPTGGAHGREDATATERGGD